MGKKSALTIWAEVKARSAEGVDTPPSPVRSGVPNKPKTKTRGFRIPDDEYEAAQETAERRGETVTDEVRRALRAYVKRNRSTS